MQKAQLLELVLGTLDRLSGVAPVLFMVEDLHWADRSTLDLAAFLVRSLRNAGSCSWSPTGRTNCTAGTRCARC